MIPSTNQYGAVAQPALSSWVVPGRNPTPLTSVWKHKRLSMAIVAVLSLIGLLAVLNYDRNYEAEATIRTFSSRSGSMAVRNTSFSSNADYPRDFVQEQVFEIDNFATASAALLKPAAQAIALSSAGRK